MSKSKIDLKNLTATDLTKKLATLRESARVIKFNTEGSKRKNVKELGSMRKNIARILTKLNQTQNG